MKQKWGREDDAGEFPSDRAVWTIGAFCVALLSAFAIGYYRYMQVWTPLQRHYLLTYAGTPVAGAFRTDAPYTVDGGDAEGYADGPQQRSRAVRYGEGREHIYADGRGPKDTAMQRRATAARDKPPTEYSCMWTLSRREKNW
jgi:hypothetical protein